MEHLVHSAPDTAVLGTLPEGLDTRVQGKPPLLVHLSDSSACLHFQMHKHHPAGQSAHSAACQAVSSIHLLLAARMSHALCCYGIWHCSLQLHGAFV